MTDAGGTTTLIKLSEEGPYMKYLLKNTSVTTAETIPFDGPSNSPVIAEDKVIILSVFNFTDETSSAGTALSAEYDETNMHFTITESGASDEEIGVVFYYVPKADPELGD